MQVQVLFPAPLAPVKGAASELIRNDELAFLYAKTAPMPPLPLYSERIHGWACVMGPGSFGNASGQPCRNGVFCRFPADLPRTACAACDPCADSTVTSP